MGCGRKPMKLARRAAEPLRSADVEPATFPLFGTDHIMRLLLSLAVLLAALAADARTGANAAPWCAYYDEFTYSCGFSTFQQCLATISGVGGVCRRNPREVSGGGWDGREEQQS